MTADIELPYPGNRTLAGWWRQFSPLRPKALWVAHLPLQTLELKVETARPAPLDRQTRVLLEAVQGSEDSRRRLDSRLCLPPSFVEALLTPLRDSHLVETPNGDALRLSRTGEAALREGRFTVLEARRRSFSFLALEPSRRLAYVPFTAQLRLPAWEGSVPEVGLIRPEAVRPFLADAPGEREERGFPLDVVRLVEERDDPLAIPLHRTERLTAAIFAVPQGSGETRLHLYPVRPETWNLPTLDPLLVLYPDDVPARTEAEWREAWLEWCRSRNVLNAETERAALSLEENYVRVRLPETLSGTSARQFEEWMKGELWLLAGGERVRQAMPIRIEW